MPKLGMEMTEGTVVAWVRQQGDRVRPGDLVLQIETEKITYDVEAPAEGTLCKVYAREGHVAPVGELLAVITAEDEVLDEREYAAKGAVAPLATHAESGPPPNSLEGPTCVGEQKERVLASPAAKRLAREKGIDLRTLVDAAPGKRVSERDVLAAVTARQSSASAAARDMATLRLGATIPVSRMRGIIAERLTRSWEVPHVYLSAEIDGAELVRVRQELLPAIERETGQKITYNDILIKIVAQAIEKFPLLNSTLEGNQIKIPADINIGLAVAVENGLLVPVLRQANHSSLAEIVRRRVDLVERARRGKLNVDELRGGTFSISNLGMFDIDSFTAVINRPQSGILAVGKLKDTPVVKEGAVSVRPVMKLTLGVDHRVVDGAVGAAFLQEVKGMMEEPRHHLAST
jgi:pyruvate dehydrogenase E2 component (dihydrolipoamide acetyltransferase)